MTPERWQRICDVFQQVRRREPTERDTLLQEACGEDADLRAEVERLLADDAGASRDGFLDVPTEPPSPTASFAPAAPILERPGDRVGPYRLLQPLGEGGMGAVFLAEQDRPVRRRVALKLIKPGMDSAQVIARFAAERQALALMDHPNIARVLDAGATEAGRPFFVMELVKGVAITEYCDGNRLTTHQRLELFIPVCRAIQHAHQKGIIHRDIKPSNVLVALVDGEPVPKVIDFGVAKAIDQRLTEQTIFTQLGALVGTPAYMSPEQADLSALDVDTRSDVYSLGVLLYELLTGSTPLERGRLRGAAYAEIARRIREEEPPRPSARLSDSGDELATIAERRGVEAGRLARLVRGELDWIAMKCLEKDRARRYETAGSLARDVERYLAGEAVEAGPPSAWYQVSKLARRHRAALVVVASFAGLLIGAAAGGTYLAVRAWSAEAAKSRALQEARRAQGRAEDAKLKTDLALAETKAAKAKTEVALKESEEARSQADAVSHFLVDTFRKPDPGQDGEKVTVVEVLGSAADRLDQRFDGSQPTRGALLNALGQTYYGLGLYDRAIRVHERAAAVRLGALGPKHRDTLTSRNNLAETYRKAGRPKDAIALGEETLELSEATLGHDHVATLTARNNLALAYVDAGRAKDAIALDKETLMRFEATLGNDHPDTLTCRQNLAEAYRAAHRLKDAIELGDRVLKQRGAKLGPDHPDTLNSRLNLAEAYRAADRVQEAIALLVPTLKLQEARLGHDHSETLNIRNNLGDAYRAAGRVPEAILLLQENLKRLEAKYGRDYPTTLASRNNLAGAYYEANRLQESVALLKENLALQEVKNGRDHPQTLASRNNLAGVYRAMGRLKEAIPLVEENLKLIEAAQGPGHADVATCRTSLIDLYERAFVMARRAGDEYQAEPLLRRAVELREKALGPEDPRFAGLLAELGACLIKQGKCAEAESILRRCVAIVGALKGDDPFFFHAKSLLGGSLLGQRKFGEAEGLILGGYRGMKAREAKIPPQGKAGLVEAAGRVVALYDAWGKPAEATAWRAELSLPAPADLPVDVFAPPATGSTTGR